ncbi:MAG: potassium channel family protein [Actinomycetes bacterium]
MSTSSDAVDEEDIPDTDATPSNAVFFPSRKLGPGGALAVRAGVAVGCLLLATVVVYLTRGGYYDNQGGLGSINILDAFYFATVSLSTTGYGDIVPSTDAARLVNAIIITPLRLIFLIVLVGSALEVLTNRTRAEFRESRWRKKLKDHTVVIGYGVKGRSAVQALVDNGVSTRDITVVSSDESAIEEATSIGCVGFVGNARRAGILERARVDVASRVIIAANADDTAALITLNVRRLSPSCTIVVAAREAQNVELLRQSGANSVITTSESAGRLMGISLVSPTAGHLMEDLLDPSQGLEVIERDVAPAEYGALVGQLADGGELVLAVVHSGAVHRFDEAYERRLCAGDKIVVIRHGAGHPSGAGPAAVRSHQD